MKLLRHAIPLVTHSRIVEMTYFVTSRCNYSCQHCFMLDQLNDRKDELSADELRKMAKYIRPLQRVHLGGGEPFLRKDISEIVQVISNEWQAEVICLPTNGSIRGGLLQTAHDFKNKCTRQLRLHFSLNTLRENYGEFTQSKDTFEGWEKLFLETKSITDTANNITLLTLLTFNDYNQDRFEEILEYVTTVLRPDDVSIGLVRPHKNYNPILDTSKFRQIVDRYFNEQSTQNPFLKAYRSLIREYLAKYYTNKCQLTKCYSGKMRVVMSPDGDVYPCETEGYPEGLDKMSYLMGNIRNYNYNINELLASKAAIRVIEKIQTQKCHCSQGIDMSLSLLCSNAFKLRIVQRGIANLMT